MFCEERLHPLLRTDERDVNFKTLASFAHKLVKQTVDINNLTLSKNFFNSVT